MGYRSLTDVNICLERVTLKELHGTWGDVFVELGTCYGIFITTKKLHRIIGGLSGVRHAKKAVQVTASLVAATPFVGPLSSRAGRMAVEMTEGMLEYTSSTLTGWALAPQSPRNLEHPQRE